MSKPTKLSDILIMSDLDGTLLPVPTQGTPPRNTLAAQRFVDKGGRFGIATGRSILITDHLLAQLPINFPSIVLNGGAIYDFATKKYLNKIFLPEVALGYAQQFHADFPDVGVIFVDEDKYIDIDGISGTKHPGIYPNPLLTPAGFERVSKLVFKIVFIVTPQQGEQLVEYSRQHSFPGVRFVFSDKHMFEMLPENSSKGLAMETIAKMAGVTRENIVAIGDYYNDIEMLEYAGLGVAPEDAPDDIKSVAQMVVCPCAQGALGDLIERLEAMYAY